MLLEPGTNTNRDALDLSAILRKSKPAQNSDRKRDPIFALIEAHARAVKAEGRAKQSLERLRAKIDARPSEKRRHEGRRLTCAVPLFDIGRRYDPVAVLRSREEIPGHVWDAIDRSAGRVGRTANRRMHDLEKPAIEELRRRYDAFQRAHRARRKAVGLTAREKAADQAYAAASDALIALTKAKPQTAEGRAALAKYMSGLGPALAPWWAMRAVMETISAV